MKAVLKSTDPVEISFVKNLLDQAGIYAMVADQGMSILEGSIGILPRRILVAEADYEAAQSLIAEAGLS